MGRHRASGGRWTQNDRFGTQYRHTLTVELPSRTSGSACVIHSLCCPVGGRPASPRKSQTKSQRGQTSGDTQLRQATVKPVKCPLSDTKPRASDARNVTGGQGVAGSNPAVPTGSEIFSNTLLPPQSQQKSHSLCNGPSSARPTGHQRAPPSATPGPTSPPASAPRGKEHSNAGVNDHVSGEPSRDGFGGGVGAIRTRGRDRCDSGAEGRAPGCHRRTRPAPAGTRPWPPS
jgi:hypothetical protein